MVKLNITHELTTEGIKMAKSKDYVVEKMRKADELASRTSGVARSQEEHDAQKKAWKEAFDAQSRAEKVGAGRGLVNPTLEDINKHKWKGEMK